MGGIGEVIEAVRQFDSTHMTQAIAGGINEFVPGGGEGLSHLSFVGGISALAIISALAWGLGYCGQPHIIVRFMALRSAREAARGRRVSLLWMVIISMGAVASGIIGVAYFAQNPLNSSTSETVFLLMAQDLFPALLAGFVMAAVLAAIMSTLSSQLIVTSSALVEDLLKVFHKQLRKEHGVLAGRLAVAAVALLAAILALSPASETVMQMVAFAWAGFGASFGPVIVLSLYWRRLTRWGALAGMVSGAVTVFVWGNVDALSGALYEIVPGFALNLVMAVVVSLATKPPAQAPVEFAQAMAGTKAVSG
jgi:sodium/proline symporter